MTVENEKARKHPYYPALDGLRAIAVLLVFSAHYLSGRVPILPTWGWVGVDFFFVLSGFLITGILFDSRETKNRFVDFYARRALRIWPLYYGVWLALLLLNPIAHWQWNAGWLLWPAHLGNYARFLFYDPAHPRNFDFLQSSTKHFVLMGHFWSLCVEEQFYLIWPALVFAARSRRFLIGLCAAIIVAEPVFRFVLYQQLPLHLLQQDFLLRSVFTRLDTLMLGGLLALLLRGNSHAVLTKYGRLISLVCVSLFACFFISYMVRTGTAVCNVQDQYLITIGLSAVALLAVGIILELIRGGKTPAIRFLTWKPLALLGRISYGFYVFHDLPHELYLKMADAFSPRQTPLHQDVTAVIAFVMTFALALLSFYLFEKPFLKLKSKFSHERHLTPKLDTKRNSKITNGITALSTDESHQSKPMS